jgi:transcriptional regulator with XRE-family HTH domain
MSQPQPLEFPSELPPEERVTLIGDRLREARVTRGLTLEDVERDTRISRHYLQALEDERFDVLPAPIYARGFMRSYAAHLGLDATEAVLSMPSELPRPEGLEPIEGLRRQPATNWPTFDPRLAIVVAAITIAVALLLWIAPRFGDGTGLPELPSASVPTLPSTVPLFEQGTTPNFQGVERAVAAALIEELGLELAVVETHSTTMPTGRVFEQAPAPGAEIETGEVVTLVISQGPVSE